MTFRSSTLRSLSVSTLCLLALTGCAPSDGGGGDAAAGSGDDAAAGQQARADYREQLVDPWFEAYNAGDAAALAGLYTADAIRYPSDAAPVSGRAAIRSAFEKELASFSETQETGGPEELHVFGDWIVEVGDWSMSGTSAEDGAEVDEEGRYMILARRGTDGQWKIHREMWTTY